MLAINGGSPAVQPGTVASWPIISDIDRQAVSRALDLATPWRWPIEPVAELEEAWTRFTGTRYALAANSGTAALHMCVAACDIEPGDEVLVPADTFMASASCVLQANAIPIFVDVDPATYNIDPAKVEERITSRTKAVIAVDLNGLPADYDALRKVTERHGLALIEDGAQSHGATYKDRQVGALGDVAGCSLNGSKPLSALGEGGLFSTNDERRRDYAARVLMFGEDEGRGRGSRDYNSRIMGWNYRMGLLEAAFASAQLTRLSDWSALRSANGNHLTKVLADLPGIRTPSVPEYATHVYFFYPLMVEPEALDAPNVSVEDFRVALRRAMAAEGVIMQEWQPRPVPAQIFFQEQRGYGRGCPWTCGYARPGIGYHPEEYPVAADICRRRLVLGQTFSSLAPPNDIALMDSYGAAFHKVLVDHRTDLYKLAKAEQSAR